MGEPPPDHSHEKCHDILDNLSLYIDGGLSADLCREIERHMEGCENCRVVIDTLTKTVKLYHEHGHARLSGGARERL